MDREEFSKDESTIETEEVKKSKFNRISVAGLEIEINDEEFNCNPIELLEEMYLIKEDKNLNDTEKQDKVREAIKKYVG